MTEGLSAQVVPFRMRDAKRCDAVVAQSSGRRATGSALLIVHTAHFHYAAEVVVHPVGRLYERLPFPLFCGQSLYKIFALIKRRPLAVTAECDAHPINVIVKPDTL